VNPRDTFQNETTWYRSHGASSSSLLTGSLRILYQ